MNTHTTCCRCGIPAAVAQVSGCRHGAGYYSPRFVVVCRSCGRYDAELEDDGVDDDADNVFEDAVRAMEDADMASGWQDYL